MERSGHRNSLGGSGRAFGKTCAPCAGSFVEKSEGSLCLHTKNRGLSPVLLLTDIPGRDFPPQIVVYLCVESRARLEMSPHCI